VPEYEERETWAGSCEQIVVQNFPNLRKDTNIKIQEVQRNPIRFNKKTTITKAYHSQIHKYTDKERIKKASRGKKSPYPTSKDKSDS
ncbi:Hypothetical predicted protein, partial [Lynx pardinus]